MMDVEQATFFYQLALAVQAADTISISKAINVAEYSAEPLNTAVATAASSLQQ
jgi:hypothetical protein